MTDDQNILDVHTFVDTVPKRELASYAHKEWAKIIQTKQADKVVTNLTLDQMFDAQREGKKLPVTIVHSYRINMLGDTQTWGEENTSSYETEDEAGKKSVTVQIEEVHTTLEMYIGQVRTFRPTDVRSYQDTPPATNRWEAKGYTREYHEYNYNAGGEWYKNHYVITCENDVVTWTYVPEERKR